MTISVFCECGYGFEASESDVGLVLACSSCDRELTIPQPGPTEEILYIPGESEHKTPLSILILRICRGIIIGCFVVGVVVVCFFNPIGCDSDRKSGRSHQCRNNLRYVGLALMQYSIDHGVFPPAAITDKNGRPLLSWRVAMLPYLDNQELYKKFHLDEPWDSPHNLPLLNEMPSILRCPSDPSQLISETGLTGFQVVIGPNSPFSQDFKLVRPSDLKGNTTEILLVGESVQTVPWTKPQDILQGAKTPLEYLSSHHDNGSNAVFADGHVESVETHH